MIMNNVPSELEELLKGANRQLDGTDLTDEEREQVLNVIRNIYLESQRKQK
jgi:hypothetical protein